MKMHKWPWKDASQTSIFIIVEFIFPAIEYPKWPILHSSSADEVSQILGFNEGMAKLNLNLLSEIYGLLYTEIGQALAFASAKSSA